MFEDTKRNRIVGRIVFCALVFSACASFVAVAWDWHLGRVEVADVAAKDEVDRIKIRKGL